MTPSGRPSVAGPARQGMTLACANAVPNPILRGNAPDKLPMTATAYRALLAELAEWFERGRETAGGRVPCRSGCTACCHGPFDISVADAELLAEAVHHLPAPLRAQAVVRAASFLDRMRATEPGWMAPYEIAELGEERFARLSDALAGEPCPLLMRCRALRRLRGPSARVPHDRPRHGHARWTRHRERLSDSASVSRLRRPAADAVCARGFEEREMECLRSAAVGRFGDADRWGFETTIAAVGGLGGSDRAEGLKEELAPTRTSHRRAVHPYRFPGPHQKQHPRSPGTCTGFRHPHEESAELLIVQRREPPGARRDRVPGYRYAAAQRDQRGDDASECPRETGRACPGRIRAAAGPRARGSSPATRAAWPSP